MSFRHGEKIAAPAEAIPGRRDAANPESITTGGNYAANVGGMDSGLAQERAPE
jgi:hypothetical protein